MEIKNVFGFLSSLSLPFLGLKFSFLLSVTDLLVKKGTQSAKFITDKVQFGHNVGEYLHLKTEDKEKVFNSDISSTDIYG